MKIGILFSATEAMIQNAANNLAKQSRNSRIQRNSKDRIFNNLLRMMKVELYIKRIESLTKSCDKIFSKKVLKMIKLEYY